LLNASPFFFLAPQKHSVCLTIITKDEAAGITPGGDAESKM
jgi:hypothetical protein